MTNSGTPSRSDSASEPGTHPSDSAYGRKEVHGRGEADDAASRAGKPEPAHQAGSGTPGYGGASGGTTDAGGLGLPGGAQTLGKGQSGTQDAGEAGTPATGGMGTTGNPGGGAVGNSGGEDDNTPSSRPAPSYGDTRPYRNTGDERRHAGHLSVAGGSAGSGLEEDDLDAGAEVVRRENESDAAGPHPSSGTAAG